MQQVNCSIFSWSSENVSIYVLNNALFPSEGKPMRDIISQIDKLKNITKTIIKNSSKKHNDINVSMKEKNSFNSYRGILSYNNKTNNEEAIKNNNNTKKNIFNGLSIKNNENKSPNDLTNYEQNKKGFNLTGYNFHKSTLYNIEQIGQKIFNSSCKKIKTCSNLNDLDINFKPPKIKEKIL